MEYKGYILVTACILMLSPYVESSDFQACGGNAADIMFVLDTSGSIRMEDFQKQLEFTKNIISIFDIGPDRTRVGVLSFSTHVEEELALGELNDKEAILDRISTVRYQGGGTNTAEALHILSTKVFVRGVMRDDVAHIAIVLTDGMSYSKNYDTLEEADKLHKSGVSVFAIGIGDQINVAELIGIASKPTRRYKFTVENYDALTSIKDELVIKTCEEPPATLPPVIPTVNGRLCKLHESIEVSIGFDMSGIGTENAKFVMQFVSNIISDLKQKSSNMTVSAVTGRCGMVNQDGDSLFTNVHNPQDVNRQMEAINYQPFNYIMWKMRLKFSRTNIRKVGLLFLDKTLNKDEFSQSMRESKYASFQGIDVIVIGVGQRVSAAQARKLAGDPSDFFHADNYDMLHNKEEEVSCVV